LFLSSLTAAIRMYITLPRLQAIHFHFCCGFVVLLLFFFPSREPSTSFFLFFFSCRTHFSVFYDLFQPFKSSNPSHTKKKIYIQKNPYFCFSLERK
jgi:hypothetical protein